MRDIKFRGKTIIDSKWIYGDMFRCKLVNPEGELEEFTAIQFLDEKLGFAVNQNVDSETVGQLTGINYLDSTGVYEGDIFHNKDFECDYEVRYDEYEARFVAFDLNNNSDEPLQECIDESAWLIGNIHDNPELLERN